MTSNRLRSWAVKVALAYVIAVCLAYLFSKEWAEYLGEHWVTVVAVFSVPVAVALLTRGRRIESFIQSITAVRLKRWALWLALVYVVVVCIACLLSETFSDYCRSHWPPFLAMLVALLAVAYLTRFSKSALVRTAALQLAGLYVATVVVLYLSLPRFRDYFLANWLWFALVLGVLTAVAILALRRATDRLRQWTVHLTVVYVLAVCLLYWINMPFREYAREHSLWFVAVLLGLAVFAYFARPRGLVLYHEYPEADEQETVDNIIALFIRRLKQQYAHQLTLRDTHPKSNGLLFCHFEVLPDLPPELKVGLFAKPRHYKCWLRFSNSEPEVTPDARPDLRGIALKLYDMKATLGTEQSLDTLQDDESDTFDFLFIAHDAFFAATPKDFLDFFVLITHYGAKFGRLLYFFPKRLRLLRNALVGRRTYGHLFEITWFSCTPYKLGKQFAKYKLHSEWARSEPDRGNTDYLRQRLTETLKGQGHTMEFMVQLQEDPHRELIETAGIPWRVPQFRTVARLHIPPQEFNSPQHLTFDENLTFNPWHCWPEHRPVGGINRARRDVMRAIQEFRLAQNGRKRADVNRAPPDQAKQ